MALPKILSMALQMHLAAQMLKISKSRRRNSTVSILLGSLAFIRALFPLGILFMFFLQSFHRHILIIARSRRKLLLQLCIYSWVVVLSHLHLYLQVLSLGLLDWKATFSNQGQFVASSKVVSILQVS